MIFGFELYVFLTSSWKGFQEIREMWKVCIVSLASCGSQYKHSSCVVQDGVVQHFRVSGAAFLENTLSLVFCTCILASAGLTLAGYRTVRVYHWPLLLFLSVLPNNQATHQPSDHECSQRRRLAVPSLVPAWHTAHG